MRVTSPSPVATAGRSALATQAQLMRWGCELRIDMLLKDNLPGVLAILDREVKCLGFEYYACAIRHLTPFTRPRTEIIGSYPAQWLERYAQQNYAAIDPSILNGLRSSDMVVWGDGVFDDCRQLWGEARECGLRVGATMPMRTACNALCVLSVARGAEPLRAQESAHVRVALRYLLELGVQRLTELGYDMLDQAAITLSHREREILQWTADGKSSGEIALILEISINTVNFHLKAIQKKFKASNKTLAAAHAAALGLI